MESSSMVLTWHDMATIIGVMVAVCGIMVALLKGFFITSSVCLKTQAGCKTAVCKKIDELKNDVKENRNVVADHYVEISKLLAGINGKTENK